MSDPGVAVAVPCSRKAVALPVCSFISLRCRHLTAQAILDRKRSPGLIDSTRRARAGGNCCRSGLRDMPTRRISASRLSRGMGY